MTTSLSAREFDTRRHRVAAALAERNLDALCLFSPAQVFYLSGFGFLPTERPIGLIYDASRDFATLFVPRLELEHAEHARVDAVRDYPEYPDIVHPMARFGELMEELGLRGLRIGVDGDGYAGGFGYVGPKLSECIDAYIIPTRDLIERMMWIKSAEEIALIRQSITWGSLAHQLLQEYTKAGREETEISVRASHEASRAMSQALGEDYETKAWGHFTAQAVFRGQIGTNSAIPHAISCGKPIQAGDVVITGAFSEVGGYISELERTMVVGVPSDRQQRFFQLMLEVQELALRTIRPGISCSAVDRAVRAFYDEHRITEYWRHHTGHGLGFGFHESPFFDVGDDTILEPGMVLSVEPGIYVSGFAGFRHADTVLITEDGSEVLSYYPRDLESLTIPV